MIDRADQDRHVEGLAEQHDAEPGRKRQAQEVERDDEARIRRRHRPGDAVMNRVAGEAQPDYRRQVGHFGGAPDERRRDRGKHQHEHAHVEDDDVAGFARRQPLGRDEGRGVEERRRQHHDRADAEPELGRADDNEGTDETRRDHQDARQVDALAEHGDRHDHDEDRHGELKRRKLRQRHHGDAEEPRHVAGIEKPVPEPVQDEAVGPRRRQPGAQHPGGHQAEIDDAPEEDQLKHVVLRGEEADQQRHRDQRRRRPDHEKRAFDLFGDQGQCRLGLRAYTVGRRSGTAAASPSWSAQADRPRVLAAPETKNKSWMVGLRRP